MLDVEAEWHCALLLLAMLGVQAAECDELLADGALSIGLLLATASVLDDPLHLLAAGQATVGVPTLVGVDQGLDAALDGQMASLLGVPDSI